MGGDQATDISAWPRRALLVAALMCAIGLWVSVRPEVPGLAPATVIAAGLAVLLWWNRSRWGPVLVAASVALIGVQIGLFVWWRWALPGWGIVGVAASIAAVTTAIPAVRRRDRAAPVVAVVCLAAVIGTALPTGLLLRQTEQLSEIAGAPTEPAATGPFDYMWTARDITLVYTAFGTAAITDGRLEHRGASSWMFGERPYVTSHLEVSTSGRVLVAFQRLPDNPIGTVPSERLRRVWLDAGTGRVLARQFWDGEHPIDPVDDVAARAAGETPVYYTPRDDGSSPLYGDVLVGYQRIDASVRVAVDLATGEPAWVREIPDNCRETVLWWTTYSRSLLVADANTLVALRACLPDRLSEGAPVTANLSLHGVDAPTGADRWELVAPQPLVLDGSAGDNPADLLLEATGREVTDSPVGAYIPDAADDGVGARRVTIEWPDGEARTIRIDTGAAVQAG